VSVLFTFRDKHTQNPGWTLPLGYLSDLAIQRLIRQNLVRGGLIGLMQFVICRVGLSRIRGLSVRYASGGSSPLMALLHLDFEIDTIDRKRL
jgi:hypothetical protein